ncbi:MAG: hypothetical protein AAGF12_07275 [Myxococcota bacterium]
MLVLFWLVSGCTVETQIRLVLNQGGSPEMIATYEIQLVSGSSCPTAEEALARNESLGVFDRDALQPIGDLEEGSYAVSVLGRGPDCDLRLFGCTVFEANGDPVEVALTSPGLPSQGCDATSVCEAGRCQPAGMCNDPCGSAALTVCAGDTCDVRQVRIEDYVIADNTGGENLGDPLSAAVTTGPDEPTVHLAIRRNAGQITYLLSFPYTRIVDELLAQERDVSSFEQNSVDSALAADGEVLEYVFTSNLDTMEPPPLLFGGTLTDPATGPTTAEVRYTGGTLEPGSFPVNYVGSDAERRVVFRTGAPGGMGARWTSLDRNFQDAVILEPIDCVFDMSTNSGRWMSWTEGFPSANIVQFWRPDRDDRTSSLVRSPSAHAFAHLGNERYLLALAEGSSVDLRTFDCGDSCGIPAEPGSEWQAPGPLVDVLAFPFADGALIITAGFTEVDAHILTPEHQFGLPPQRLYTPTLPMRQVRTMEGVVFEHLGRTHLVLFVMLEISNDGGIDEIVLVHTQFG